MVMVSSAGSSASTQSSPGKPLTISMSGTANKTLINSPTGQIIALPTHQAVTLGGKPVTVQVIVILINMLFLLISYIFWYFLLNTSEDNINRYYIFWTIIFLIKKISKNGTTGEFWSTYSISYICYNFLYCYNYNLLYSYNNIIYNKLYVIYK